MVRFHPASPFFCAKSLKTQNVHANIYSMEGKKLGDVQVGEAKQAGDAKQTEHKKGGKALYWILGGVGLVAVIGLIVGIVFINLNGGGSNGDCSGIEDEYEMRSCLGKMYVDGDENTDTKYEAAAKAALDEGNYDLFRNIVFDRGTDLAVEKECEKALPWVDHEDWIERLPIEDRALYYEQAMDVAVECDDDEKYKEYEEKWDALYWDYMYDSEDFYTELNEDEMEEVEKENLDEE